MNEYVGKIKLSSEWERQDRACEFLRLSCFYGSSWFAFKCGERGLLKGWKRRGKPPCSRRFCQTAWRLPVAEKSLNHSHFEKLVVRTDLRLSFVIAFVFPPRRIQRYSISAPLIHGFTQLESYGCSALLFDRWFICPLYKILCSVIYIYIYIWFRMNRII